MKVQVIKPSVAYMDSNHTNYDIFIESVGRTCYKSEDKITEGSAIKFVRALVKRQHLAMLEHWRVYIRISDIPEELEEDFSIFYQGVTSTARFNIYTAPNGNLYISANFRELLEYYSDIYLTDKTYGTLDRSERNIDNCLISELYMNYPDIFCDILTEYGISLTVLNNFRGKIEILDRETWNEKFKNDFLSGYVDDDVEGINLESLCTDYLKSVKMDTTYHTFRIICDRGVSHEIVRHRLCSFAQESTRYVNYSNAGIQFIKPCFWKDGSPMMKKWQDSMELSAAYYNDLINNGASPQEARGVLPNSLKTEIIVTANEVEWQHMINLRYHGTTGNPHPQIKEVFEMIYPIICQASEGRIS